MLIFRKFISPVLKLQKQRFFYCAYLSTVLPKEEKVKVDKWDINYVKVGQGPHNVLCLPGALGTIWTDFKPQIEGFNREKFTLIVWDPPGYGKSRPPEKEFTADFYEKDADYASEFMKALNIPKYSVLGWSDGGTTSFIHAAKYPDSTIKLVAWGTNSFILPHELEMYNKVRDIASWSAKMKAPFVEVYGEKFLETYWHKWNDGVITVYNSNQGNICSHILKNIKCPTFILYGEKDPMVDPVHASHLLTNISDSRLHLYPKGKHNIHINYAADFNQRVQEFLLKP